MHPRFDVVLESDAPLPPPEAWRFRTLLEVLSAGSETVFVGFEDDRGWAITRADVLDAAARAAALPLASGATVLLVRLPETNEAPLAAALFALIQAGYRVLVPAQAAAPRLGALARQHGATSVVADLRPRASAAHRREVDALRAELADLPAFDLVTALLDGAPAPHPEAWPDPPEGNTIVTTSGSTAEPRSEVYDFEAFMAAVAAWDTAGLLNEAQLSGPGVCPTLPHTMGIREATRALWCGTPTLFITAEWFEERPYQVVRALTAHPPSHITCGPALLHGVDFLAQKFPLLVREVAPRLRCIVSSGAAASDAPLRHMRARIYNAFGTTETQQVLTTLLAPGAPTRTLGRPLPGAAVAVAFDDDQARAGRLYIRSPFASRAHRDQWWDSGDRVCVEGEGLRFIERAAVDFVQTGQGLKLALAPIEALLLDIHPEVRGILVIEHPAAAALIGLVYTGDSAPDDSTLQSEVAHAIAARQLVASAGDSFSAEYAGLTVVGFVGGAEPMTALGKRDRRRALREQRALIDALVDPYGAHRCRVEIPAVSGRQSAYQGWSYPRLGQLLEGLGLDWEFTRGEGDVLWATRDGAEVPVLDLVGGYGTNLLGHGQRALLEAAAEAAREVPICDQGSARRDAGELCRRLAIRAARETDRTWLIALASTGSEAVELALQHAALERGRRLERLEHRLRVEYGWRDAALVDDVLAHNRRVLDTHQPPLLALERAFHGKTLGAREGLGDPSQREPFSALLRLKTVFLDADGGPRASAALREVIARNTVDLIDLRWDGARLEKVRLPTEDVLAVLAEPIQGEGGVHVVPEGWLRQLGALQAPLIIDEIQSGLGRAGSWLASGGGVGDYLLLGKALGGGVAKISALLIDRARYVDRFDELRGSTFGEDRLSCRVALRALEQIDALDVPGRTRDLGARLGRRLRQVQERYPRVVKGVRGAGAMWGLELTFPNDPPAVVLNALAERGIGYLSAAYLLNVHKVRAMPTTSAPNTLRIQPSYALTDAQIEVMGEALEAVCRAWDRSNLFELIAHCLPGSPDLSAQRTMAERLAGMPTGHLGFEITRDAPAPGAVRVAFVHNPVQTSKLLLADAPALALLSSTQRLELIDRFQRLLEFTPMPSFSKNLFGGRVWMQGITVAATPTVLDHLRRRGEEELIQRQMQAAYEVARAKGCQVVTYGAFTSVVTRSATTVHAPDDVVVCSGNSFTVAATLAQLRTAAEEHGVDVRGGARVAVLGALGNIGSALCHMVFARLGLARELTLVGRAGSEARLDALTAQLKEAWRVGSDLDVPPIRSSTDVHDLARADIVIAATSAAEPLVWPEHIAADRPVLVADLSEPTATSPDLAARRPNVRVQHIGLVTLPEDPDFVMSAHTPPGTSFACAAEGILVGLGHCRDGRLRGPIDVEVVDELYRQGRALGMLP